eukprot:629659-Rhodomonas_salina.6
MPVLLSPVLTGPTFKWPKPDVEYHGGCSKAMETYYRHWEKSLCDALVHTVLEAVAQFADLLGMVEKKGDLETVNRTRPMIRVFAKATPNVVISPSILEIQKMITRSDIPSLSHVQSRRCCLSSCAEAQSDVGFNVCDAGCCRAS